MTQDNLSPEKQLEWLAGRFGYFTECELATLEELRGKKSASQRDLRRHQEIADGMVAVCRELGDSCVGRRGTPRLSELLGVES